MLHYIQDALAAAPKAAEQLSLAHVSRRGFLAGTTAGFAVAAFAGNADAFARYKTGGETMAHGLRYDPHLFIAIDPDGTVTLTAHRSEMGTGSRTSLPMVIADEMGADWDKVKIIQAPGDEPKYGNQDTDGSRSMRHHIQSMRQMGASVRHMLAQAAADTAGVDVKDVSVGVHEVTAGGQTFGFGDLAEAAMQVPVPAFEDLAFKDESEFRYIGQRKVPIYDLHDITTGKAIYGSDVSLPGMKVACIARPPVLGASPTRYDATEAWKVSGVEQVMGLPVSNIPAKFAPKGGIAVIASNTDAAIKGRDALQIEWGDSPHASYNSAEFTAEMRETAAKPGNVLRAVGDARAAIDGAAKTFKQQYHQAHMIHAMMEPPSAIAQVAEGKAEIWAPVQSPYGTRQDVAAALNMNEADVTVHVTLLGGGFGRKSKCDFVIEAALLSQKTGAPIRVQWTREDDIQHGFYHTTSVEELEVGMDANGAWTGYRHNSVAPSILSTFAPDSGHQFFIESGMGHLDHPFHVPNVSIENGKAMAHTRIGWFRAVSNIPRAWAQQTFLSELAAEQGQDELEAMLAAMGPDRKVDIKAENYPDDYWDYGEVYENYPIDVGRWKNTLRLAAEKGGWGKDMPEGEGLGLASHRSFVTYVAACAHVKMVDGKITVPQIDMAIDCGFAANPERIESQLQGAAVQGMTAALYSAITYENGAVEQANYDTYEMVRSDNFPLKVNVHIVPHPFSVHASGVGEPGVPPVAPAIGNALFHATGKRFRDIPFGDTA
ncbi:MAG: molybdopterin cofactor-binding domain-containing protein [Pseudomonadota bacterium]